MGVLTIRNVDDAVITALKARAKVNHRSLEGELRHLLSRYAVPRPALGVVRERARMAAAYKTTPSARDPEIAEAVQSTGSHVDARAAAGWMGAMRDVGEIVGDIVSPVGDPSDWEVLRPATAPPKDVPAP